MNRRETLGVVAACITSLSGCIQPTVTERPTGEIDISFRTDAARDYLIQFELINVDGNTKDTFESGFPPDQQGAPCYYSAGLSNGSYTVIIETESEHETFEWAITDCSHLDVEVTILADGQVDIERTCATT